MNFLYFSEGNTQSNSKGVWDLRINIDAIDAIYYDEKADRTVIVAGQNSYWVKQSRDEVIQQIQIVLGI